MGGRHGNPSIIYIPNYVQCKVCSQCGSILGDQGRGHLNVLFLLFVGRGLIINFWRHLRQPFMFKGGIIYGN